MKNFLFSAFLLVSLASAAQLQTDIAGKAVPLDPQFLFVNTFNDSDPVYASVNVGILDLDGITADIYITADKSQSEWESDPTLIDVRASGAQQNSFAGIGMEDLWVQLDNTDELASSNGPRPSHGYDVVIDVDQNGELSSEDIIDGWDDTGFYLVAPMGDPGPFQVDSAYYSSPTGEWQTFQVYYPTNIEELEAQPLVVISHGWTHHYWYYEFLGVHLASYGYIAMTHRNDVGNGGSLASTTASTSALNNIDTLLTIYPDLAGGILAGKIDKSRIVHTGHSTGGECVARSYKRLYDGDYESPHITHEDIVSVISLAGVAFLSEEEVHPEEANYHQFLCGADTDVSGAPIDAYVQAFSTFERGYGNKHVTYIHGAGHEDLHGEIVGNPLASGPDLIGKEATHTVLKPYFLALCELYTRNDLAMKEFFTRNTNEFVVQGIEEGVKISNEYHDALSVGNTVIDDFETGGEMTSSSGGSVSASMDDYYEILMQDINGTFGWFGDQWSNGMCRARYEDDPNCAVFGWDEEDHSIEFEITEAINDWTTADYLSFRTCQMTRHPYNVDWDGDIAFDVRLTDAAGESAKLNFAAYGKASPPYPRGAGDSEVEAVFETCLEEGTYSIYVGGSEWESEMSFIIPDYLGGGSGTYDLEIGPGDPCTDIEIQLFDSWGDGWDDGILQIIDGEENVVLEITLEDGFGADSGVGWQNEFYTVRMRLTDFLTQNSDLNLGAITTLTFEVGPEHDCPMGAMGLDDIELVSDGLSFVTHVESDSAIEHTSSVVVFPNPASDWLNIRTNFTGSWQVRVLDVEGREVIGWRNNNYASGGISINALPAGLYVVQVLNDNHLITRSITKQ